MNWRCLVVPLLLVGAAPRPAAAQPAAAVLRFAIVIGNNQPPSNDAERLRYADDDAVATHELLLDAGVDSHLLVTLDGDSQQLHSHVKRDGAPSLRNLERVFASLSASMRVQAERGGSSELLIFYSGHGDVEHGEGFVVLEDQPLTRSKLYALLTRSPAARNHVFVDACKSYFLIYAKGPGGKRSAYAPAFLDGSTPGQLANTGFILSTSSDRDSHEWEHYQAGILSHELRSALRGAADADLDGRISYAELGAFLTVANQGIPNPKFKPDFLVRAPGSAPKSEIIAWKSELAVLQVDGSAGHVYVETARGERLLDVHAAVGETVRLRLPRLRPLFVRKDDESAESSITSDAAEQVVSLRPILPEVRRKGALNLAFRQLFAVPFGLSKVREFERTPRTLFQPGAHADEGLSATPVADSVRSVAGWVAIATAGAGVTLNAISLGAYLNGEGSSQVEIATVNQRIRTLNIASLACYGVAGAATLTWAWIKLGIGGAPVSKSARNVPGASGLTLQLGGEF